MKKLILLIFFLILSAKISLGQDASYSNLTTNTFTKSGGYTNIFGWSFANDNTTDPRPNWRPDAQPYMINNHTGLTLSAHSFYGGIRFYNQGYPNPYDPATGAKLVMSIVNGNVGIGTVTPNTPLHLTTSHIPSTDIPMQQWDPSQSGYNLVLSNYNGTHGLDYRFTQLNGNTSYPVLTFQGGNVGIGTQNPDTKLAVQGTIHATEIKVDQSVPTPDYVFDKDYDLASLKDVKTYIDKNHHLPEIPSAGQVAKDGINLGEMNTKLLKKIEELTLYLIEQKEETDIQIKALKLQIKKLSNQRK